MDNVNEKTTKEEFTLVDLLVIILKHRFLILGTFAVAVVVFLVWNFSYTAYLKEKHADDERNKTSIETNLTLMANPALNALIPDEVSTVSIQIFRDPPLLLSALKNAGIIELVGRDLSALSELEITYIVRQLLVDGKTLDGGTLGDSQKPFLVRKSGTALILTFRNTDLAKAQAFLLEVSQLADASVLKVYAPLAKAAIEDYERFLQLPLNTALDQTNAAAYYASYTIGRRLIDGSLKPFLQIGEPYATISIPSPPSVSKVAGIFVFAALFLSIFTAFLLEYIDHIKNSPDSRAKISAALAHRKKNIKIA